MRLPRPKPIPSAALLAGFLVVAVIAFGIAGAWMLARMDQVRAAAEQSREDAAAAEALAALRTVERAIQGQLVRIGDWEEARQQILNPMFYDYWLSNRALEADRIEPFVLELRLYDRDGVALGVGGNSGPRLLPDRLDAGFEGLQRRDGLFAYTAFGPVRATRSGTILGYAGIAADLLQAVHDLVRFRFVEPLSITFSLDEGGRLDRGALPGAMRFAPRPGPETSTLERLMRQTLWAFWLIAGTLGLLAWIGIGRFLHRPLRELSAHIQAMRTGLLRSGGKTAGRPLLVRELETVRRSLEEYQADLDAVHAELDRKNRELWDLAHHDPLTGAGNRRAYDEDWRRLEELVRGQRLGVSVMLIDCDHFKAINDTYGHEVGDEVLRAVAGCLRGCLREGDRLYRLGGDEFAVHLLSTGPEEARRLAERCLQAVSNYPFARFGVKESVRFSIGLAHSLGTHAAELAQLHRHADIAMYRAKRPGQNKIAFYDPQIDAGPESLFSSRDIHMLYEAIEKGRGLELHYQPIVSLRNDCRGFYEVLSRLRDDQGMIPPSQFLRVIAAENLWCEFDATVVRGLAAELDAGRVPAGVGLSLNIDGMSLLDDRFLRRLAPLSRHLQRNPIILEITETALITELQAVSSVLESLRADGFRTALDDFGSGYSSLRYLATMPVDIVKFDISMIHDLEGDAAQQRIVADLARMILDLDYQLVAEGVETETLLEQVRALGFSHAQGYLFSHPSPKIPREPPSLLHAVS